MPTLEDLATETLFQIGEYLDTSSLSALCLTNKRMSNLFSPMLYTNIKSSNPVASLKLFAGLAANPEAGYIGLYRDRIRSISIEYSETTFKIKVPLLLALAKCIEQGYFPSLREFKWAHLVYYRATFDPTPHPALRYDEPLWRALLQHQPPLEKLSVSMERDYFHPWSIPSLALCDLRDKCAVFVPLDVGTEQWKSAWGAYFTSRFSWPPFLLEIWPLSKEGWWNFGSEDSPRFYEEGNLVERLHLIDSVTWEAPSARSFFLRFRRGGTMSEVGEDEIDGLSEFDEYENIGEEFSPSELDGYQVLEGDGIVSGIDELEGEVDESGTLSELQEVVEN